MIDTEWPRTIWSEARQVNRLNGLREMAEDHLAPASFLRELRRAGRGQEAVLFLAQALPRYEAVGWAKSVLDRLSIAQPAEHAAALAAVGAWLDDPSEANRRAVGELAGRIDPPAPATLCALAAFHAGGSIAPDGRPAASPPRGSTGRFAGAAVIAALGNIHPAAQQLERALDDGELLARMTLETGR